MDLRNVDLNLLVVLDSIVEHRSVSRAAARLKLSQSAVSHALQRLRHRLNDELLVRENGAMQPTPAAIRLMETVRPALAQLGSALADKRGFDSLTSTRGFVLRMSEYVAPSVLTPLCTRLRRDAPGVRLTVLPVGGAPEDRTIEPGELHLRAERGTRTLARPTSQMLFKDDFVVLMATHHAGAHKALTLEHYVALPHIKVAADAVGTNMIDDALQRFGVRRNIVMTVPSWFAMRRVVAGTDLVAVVPRHWTADPSFATGCICRDLPLDDVALSVELVWHARDTTDSGIAWLRATLADLLRAGPVNQFGV
ncbi:MAG TPA: LysR family transcriptional regulator [Rhodopila sp.]|nr:LysR family transcriptional regulator [Rhodopila sp.]